jgi:hypothetical protein
MINAILSILFYIKNKYPFNMIIISISGATISVDAITKNINIVNKVIKSIIISDLKEIK